MANSNTASSHMANSNTASSRTVNNSRTGSRAGVARVNPAAVIPADRQARVDRQALAGRGDAAP